MGILRVPFKIFILGKKVHLHSLAFLQLVFISLAHILRLKMER